jgi:hypothetical protein
MPLGLLLRGEDQALLVRGRGQLLLPHLDEPRHERGLLRLGGEARVHAPVLEWDECLDLALAVDDQSEGHRLHTACGQGPPLQAFLEERRQLEPHQPVEDPPGLLGVHQIEVDPAGFLEGPLHRVARDLRERDPVRGTRVGPDGLGDVPCDGLAFAVEVGGEPQPGGALVRLPELGDDVLLGLEHLVLGLEVVVDLDAHAVLGEVPDVALAGRDRVVGAEVSLQGLRLGRRLDDHQLFRHTFSSFYLRGFGRQVRGTPAQHCTS